MVTAREARALTKNKIEEDYNEKLEKVVCKIEQSIENKLFYCYIDECIPKKIKVYLESEEMGYKVTYEQTGINETSTKIEW